MKQGKTCKIQNLDGDQWWPLWKSWSNPPILCQLRQWSPQERISSIQARSGGKTVHTFVVELQDAFGAKVFLASEFRFWETWEKKTRRYLQDERETVITRLKSAQRLLEGYLQQKLDHFKLSAWTLSRFKTINSVWNMIWPIRLTSRSSIEIDEVL